MSCGVYLYCAALKEFCVLLLHNGADLYAGLLRCLAKCRIWMCYFYKVCLLQEENKTQFTYNSTEKKKHTMHKTRVGGSSTGSEVLNAVV